MTSSYKAGKQEISCLADGKRFNSVNNATFIDKNIRETKIVIYLLAGRMKEKERRGSNELKSIDSVYNGYMEK